MAQRELIAALREDGENRCAACRHQGEELLTELRHRHAAEMVRLREEAARKLSRREAAVREEFLTAAAKDARLLILSAEHALAQRLLTLARMKINLFRSEEYPRLFTLLVTELPACRWDEVRVNPADGDLAAAHFPAAAIVPDETVSGGFMADGDGGRIRIINTLGKRLERAWEELLPRLFTEIRGRM